MNPRTRLTPKEQIEKVLQIIAEYDAKKGFFKRSRSAVLNEILQLAKEVHDDESAFVQKNKIIQLVSHAFKDFHHQGNRRVWDWYYSQTQLALLKLDFLLNDGKLTHENINNDIGDRNQTEFLISLSQRNLLHEIAKYYDINQFDLNSSSESSDCRNSALHWAIMNNSCDSALTLINQESIDLSVADKMGKNALHMAILKGREHKGDIDDRIHRAIGTLLKASMKDVVSALLNHAAIREIINSPMRDGNTPLHLAYMRHDNKLCAKLIALEANESIRNNAGLLPIDMMKMSKDDVIKYIKENTGDTATLSIFKPDI